MEKEIYDTKEGLGEKIIHKLKEVDDLISIYLEEVQDGHECPTPLNS